MAFEEKVESITLLADASIAIYTGPPNLPGSAVPNYGKLFCFVKVTGDETVGLCTAAAGELPVGVLQNKPQHVGNSATVGIRGVTRLMTGTGGLAAGNSVKSDAAGKGIAASGTDPVYAIALKSAVAGSLAPVLLRLGE